jgi:hypothetical protein
LLLYWVGAAGGGAEVLAACECFWLFRAKVLNPGGSESSIVYLPILIVKLRVCIYRAVS